MYLYTCMYLQCIYIYTYLFMYWIYLHNCIHSGCVLLHCSCCIVLASSLRCRCFDAFVVALVVLYGMLLYFVV